MKSVIKIFNELASTNSANEKEEIIRRNLDNELFDYCIRFYLDDMVVTGIARAKLNKLLKSKNAIHGSMSTNLDDVLNHIKHFNTGRETDIQYVINSARLHNDTEIEQLYYSLVCKDLKIGTGISTYNKANPNNPIYIHDIMAGKAWDEERALKMIKNKETIYFSEKVDGNRGTRNLDCTAIISRNGKTWEGTQSILEECNLLIGKDFMLDGELVYNDKTNSMTSQEIRSMTTSIMNDSNITDKALAGIVFKIFEVVKVEDWNSDNIGEPYSVRRKRMDELSNEMNGFNYVQIIPTEFTVSNEEELSQVIPKLKAFINSGKEGLMSISSKQVYKTGKGYQMMKLKNVISADLKIVGWNYGKEKTKWEGKFASFTVEFPYVDKNGVKCIYNVNVGTGYSDDFRIKANENPDMYIGKILECLVTEISKNKDGGYSFSYARFVDIRDDKNTIDLEGHTLIEVDGEMYFKADKEIVDNEE